MAATPVRPEIGRQISWVYTRNADAAFRFYGEILELECLSHRGDARVYGTGPSSAIGVCPEFDNRVAEPAGSLISLVTDDVDGWHERLSGKNVEVVEPPHRFDRFGIYTLFVRGPDGYLIEFQQHLD